MAYREWPVLSAGHERLACAWSRQQGDEQAIVPIVPDGCMDLIWSSHDEAIQVAGPDSVRFLAELNPGEELAGVRFNPGAAAEVLGVPAVAIRDARVPLAELWGTDANRIAELVGAASDRALALEALAADRVVAAGRTSLAIVGIVELARDGTDVRRMAADLGISERKLRRTCLDAFGYGPKVLQRILRFQQAKRLIEGGVPLADVAYQAGYSDQAHLTREVTSLAGTTPTRLRPAARTLAAS
jgi:AraC-like DNA-binding protein